MQSEYFYCSNDPKNCNWPGCGCDPYANKVLEAFDEKNKESMDIIRECAALMKKDKVHIEDNGCMTDSPKAKRTLRKQAKLSTCDDDILTRTKDQNPLLSLHTKF